MHLCFLDESSPPPKPKDKGKGRFFVIAGLAMHEDQWHGVASSLKTLLERREYQVQGELKWRYFGPDNKDPENSVAHLSADRKNELRFKIYELITARKSIRIMACVANVDRAYDQNYISSADDLYAAAYKPVTERFQYYLQDVSRVVGSKQLGIIVADQRGKSQDDQLRRQHRGLVQQRGQFSSAYTNYIETVFLTPSHHSVGIQLVDLIAGAIGRYYNANDHTYVSKLWSSFRAAPNGRIEGYGLVKIPHNTW
jgi:hypothetical protein